jgi:hypothetical protein
MVRESGGNMNRGYFILVALSIFLCGCATVRLVDQPTEKIGRNPELGLQSNAPVGAVIFQQYRYTSRTAYRLLDALNMGFKLGRITTASGEVLASANIGGKAAYCTQRNVYFDPLVGPQAIACFIDSKQSGVFDRVTAAPGPVWFENELPNPLRYEKYEQFLARQDSFKYELLYMGVSNKTLRLNYREFVNDLARPAFYQDVSYDLSSLPASINFRSVRIEVISANNDSMNYRILSGF